MSSKPKIIKTDAEWRAQLTPMQYEVTRNQATERPFTGPWLSEKRAGLYRCVACGAPLFRSEAKYESGCGWPSFFVPADGEAIAEIEDFSHGMHRVEMRYCTNGTALDLAPDDAGGEKR